MTYRIADRARPRRHRTSPRRMRVRVAAAAAAVACGATLVAMPGASAQVLPPILGGSTTTEAPPTTKAPTPTTKPPSTTTTTPSTPTPKPGGRPPVPKIVRQPVADPVFDQGVKVDRLQGLLIQAQLGLTVSGRKVAAAHKAVSAASARASRANRALRVANAHVRHSRDALAEVAIGSYVAGPGGSLQATLRGDPRPVYRDMTLTRARQDLLADQHAAAAKRHAAASAHQALTRAKADEAAAKRAQTADNQKIASLLTQADAAEKRLAELALGDRAISPEEAETLLAAALRRRGLDGFGAAPPLDSRVLVAIQFAMQQLGKPYQWGGNGPNAFDCSGLTQQSFLHAGTTIPRVAADQQDYTVPVSAEDARPGDLVFFGTPATHVGLYLGNGNMINAPYTGTVVRVEPVYRTSISGFGRVVFTS